MNKQLLRFLQSTLFILDIIILNLVIIICKILFNVLFNVDILKEHSEAYKYWILINSFWVIFAWLGGVYAEKSILSFELFSARTVKAYIIWSIFLILFLFFTQEELPLGEKLFIASTILIFGLGLFVNRFAYMGIRMYFRKTNQLVKRILIIGHNDTSRKLASYLEQEGINTEIVGFTENEKNVKEPYHYPLLSDIDSSVEVSKQLKVHEIFSTITPEQDPRLYQLIRQAEDECIRFKIVPDFSVFIKGQFHRVSYFNDMPILTLRSEPLDDFNNRVKKRAFDIAFSLFVIVFILTWLVPLLSILIIMESRGPIFFSQLRTGKNKKTFRCYKFRSMYVNHDAEVKQATKNDKRVTKIGKILRRTSLDEFPQFINVLLGNMSIVGPRPHMVTHTNHYSKIVDQYMVRHFSKPGITGWAQINGYRGEIEEPKQIKGRVKKDIEYMENWSLLLDTKIVFLTVFNVLKGEEKAY